MARARVPPVPARRLSASPLRSVRVAVLLASCCAVVALAEEAPELAKALDNPDAAARTAAVDRLRQSADRESVIVGALRDPETRATLGPAAQEALADLAGELNLRFANSGLRSILRDDAAPLAVRKAAARALGRTGSVADVSVLGDAIAAIPEEASRALAAIGGTSAQSALLRGGGENPPLEVLAAMTSFGDDSGLPKLVAALTGPDAGRAARLLKWATGHDLPAERAAWETHLRRREVASRFADSDNDKAGDAVDACAAELRRSPGSALESDLIDLVKDVNWPVFARTKAAISLGLGGSRAAKDALLWACRDGENGAVRMYAANALAFVGDLSCAVPLERILVNDEDKDRISGRRSGEGDFFPTDPCIIRALYRIGCRGAATRAIELIAGEYRTRLHRDCQRALGEFSGGETFGFQPDASKAERAAAVDRIRAWWREARESIPLAPRADDPGWEAFRRDIEANIKELGGFKFLYQLRAKLTLIDLAEPALPQLTAALSHEDEHIRMGTADVLAASALRDAAPGLAARLAVEPKSAVRTRLLVALEVCGRPWTDGRAPAAGVADAVRGALDDRSLDVRIAAARTLGVVGEAVADTARLAAASAEARNADDTFRFASAAARLRLCVRSCLPELATQLRSDDVALRSEAAKALAAAGLDLRGFDPDQPAELREAAIGRILELSPAALSTVPYKERK